jgi:large subunit ribosomal protein L13Ae
MVSGSGVCAKRIVVDARHHMLGRLSSIIAKELLNDQKVVVARCEEICLSANPVCQKVVWQGLQPDGRKVIRDLALILWVMGRTARS